MADMTLKCAQCSKTLTVSEFVDTTAVSCPECGSKLQPATTGGIQPPVEQKRTWKVAHRPETRQGPERPEETLAKVGKKERKKDKEFKRSNRARGQRIGTGWLLFVLLGGITGALRWGGFMGDTYIEMLKSYGALLILVFYVVILFRAFEDSAFSGIVSLVFPPYSVYYLFAVSDDYVLRGVVAGTIVGFGYECGISLTEQSAVVFQTVNDWIMRGGS